MAKRTQQIAPAPRAVDVPPADGGAMVPSADVDVWEGALRALAVAREAIRACATFATTRPGRSHAGAVQGLSEASAILESAARGVTAAKAEVEAAECDGNAMSIIGTIARRLKREVRGEAADEWRREAMDCGSYDAILRLAMRVRN